MTSISRIGWLRDIWKFSRTCITASQSTGNLWKLKLYICTLEVRSSEVLYCMKFCTGNVPYLRSENNLRQFDFLRKWRFELVQKCQVSWLTVVSKSLIDNLFSTLCLFLFLRICHRLIWKKHIVHQHEILRIENFAWWRRFLRSCQWVVNKQWRVFEPKMKKFWKSLGLKWDSFSTKVTGEQMQKICSSSTVVMFQTFEKLLYQKRREIWKKISFQSINQP